MCPSFIQQHGGKKLNNVQLYTNIFLAAYHSNKHIFALYEQGLRFENEVAFHDITFVVLYGIA